MFPSRYTNPFPPVVSVPPAAADEYQPLGDVYIPEHNEHEHNEHNEHNEHQTPCERTTQQDG